jgi:D-arabinose 1-dehydrogenase-like Zn-dependent alcohol dehydrogenase
MTLDPERMLLEELVVAGTRYATRTEIAQTMELVRLGKVAPIIGARAPLEDLDEALGRAKRQEIFGRLMIDVTALPEMV